MWGKKKVGRLGLVAVFALVFMSVGLVSASAGGTTTSTVWQPATIWAESNDCGSVTIYFALDDEFKDQSFNAQGTVNGAVKNGNGVGWTSITFDGVEPGTAEWSGSMWWAGDWQDFNQGTIQVEPCPVTTTTPTTQPTDSTTSSTIGQVETDLGDDNGGTFGFTAILAALGVSILGGTAIVASRRRG